jgi:hypothetical protein
MRGDMHPLSGYTKQKWQIVSGDLPFFCPRFSVWQTDVSAQALFIPIQLIPPRSPAQSAY